MEGVEGGDHFVGAVPVQLSVATGKFQRALIGLGSAIAKKYLVQTTVFYENLGQL